MKSDIFLKMTLDEIRDIFLVKVEEFMKLTEQKNSDPFRIRDLKQEIERLQEIMNLEREFSQITPN
jgi:hypothetical protein